MALARVTQQPFVTSTLLGATTLEQLATNLGAAGLRLSEGALQEIGYSTADRRPAATRQPPRIASMGAASIGRYGDSGILVVRLGLERRIDATRQQLGDEDREPLGDQGI